jgi:hypothetical protein
VAELEDARASGVRAHGREGSTPSWGTRESEPARVLGLAANECAVPTVTFKSSALRVVFGVPERRTAMENEPARVPAPLGKRLGGRPLGFEFSVLRSWMAEAAEAQPRLEPGWARKG